jgi:hypothetical protein
MLLTLNSFQVASLGEAAEKMSSWLEQVTTIGKVDNQWNERQFFIFSL